MTSKPRHRDLWISYIAQVMIGAKPEAYPEIGNDIAEDERLDSGFHKIGRYDQERIRRVVSQNSPRPSDKTSQGWIQILKLCAENIEQYPYDLILSADEIMMQDHRFDGNRIASVVCERMLEVYDTMVIEQRGAQGAFLNHIKSGRLSLRRVLVRFCNDSYFYPQSLFIYGIEFPDNKEIIAGGGFADVFTGVYQNTLVALKGLRIFTKNSSNKEPKTIVVESIILSRLNHPNLLPFTGLYMEPRNDIEITFIVCPWQERGDILECMSNLKNQDRAIPRIRWIYEIACGLRYLHDEFVVHGDLHGGNILVSADMHVRIADFGLSSVEEPTVSARITVVQKKEASSWSSPELTDEGVIGTFASDVWAFGCACLLIWTGEGPYLNCKHSLQVLKALINPQRTPEDPEHLMHTFYDDQPEQQAQGAFLRECVALPCWSREPEDRPRMQAIAETLLGRFRDLPEIQ